MSRDAERAIISALLLEPAAIRDAANHITPDDFHDIRLGRLYGLIAGMVSAGGQVDAVLILDELRRRRATDNTWLSFTEVTDLTTGDAAPALITEHARVVRDAAVRRQATEHLTRAYQYLTQGADPGPVIASALDGLRAVRDGHRGSDLSARTLGDVLAEPDVYEWVIPGLLEKADRVIFTGGEGAGKTTLVRQITCCAAAGVHPFTGERIDPLRVLVVDAENSERQWRRNARGIAAQARRKGIVDPQDTVILACTRRLDVTSQRDLGSIHRLMDEYAPDLVVIGPLYKLVPRAITNDDDAAPLITALDSLRDRGVALVMEAHAGHGQSVPGQRDLRPRGSSALLGWPEFGFGLSLDKDQPHVAHLVRWRGDREERSWPESLERGGEFPWSLPRWTPHRSLGAAS